MSMFTKAEIERYPEEKRMRGLDRKDFVTVSVRVPARYASTVKEYASSLREYELEALRLSRLEQPVP